MIKIVSVLLVMALLTACTNKNSLSNNLVCQLIVKDKQSCTPVLSLESGELRLDAEKSSFELKARYDACYQFEEVKITGDYEQRTHKSILNIELLAKQITEMKSGKLKQFPRTIGLVTLNIESQKGYFVDIGAMISAHGQMGEGLYKVDVSCDSEAVTK